MNSDRFDRVVMDLLYGELDELTTAAARRHVDQSARARDIYTHLSATRKLSALPSHAPRDDFAATVIERERDVFSQLPLHQRVGHWVSKLAGYAMRPQLAMGTLLLLMIGSSLMFLRAKPGQHSAVQVTGRGAPEAEVERLLPVAPLALTTESRVHDAFEQPRSSAKRRSRATSPPRQRPQLARLAGASQASTATAGREATHADDGLDPFDQAVQLYRAGRYDEAERRFERLSHLGGARAAEAALYAAQATRDAAGCGPAVGQFDAVRLRFPGSGPAYEATWRAAKCLHQLGSVESARQNYAALLQVNSHARRARRALEALGDPPRPTATRAADRLRRRPVASDAKPVAGSKVRPTR